MKMVAIRKAIIEDGNDVYFDYKRKKCGIEPTVVDGVFKFVVWYGQNSRTYSTFERFVDDPIFDGKTFSQILPRVDIFLG